MWWYEEDFECIMKLTRIHWSYKQFIPEQFTVKAHPALFGGSQGRGWAKKRTTNIRHGILVDFANLPSVGPTTPVWRGVYWWVWLFNPLVVTTRRGYKLITSLGFSDFIGLMYEINSDKKNLEFLVSELSKVAFRQPKPLQWTCYVYATSCCEYATFSFFP